MTASPTPILESVFQNGGYGWELWLSMPTLCASSRMSLTVIARQRRRLQGGRGTCGGFRLEERLPIIAQVEHLPESASLDPRDAAVRGMRLIDDPATLDEGLRLMRYAVLHTPRDDRALPGRLLNLGVAVEQRWERDHDPADLDEAIDIYRQAAPLAEVRVACLTNLCHALRMRHRLTGAGADLDAAVAAGASCLAIASADDDRRADRLEQAAHARRERYELVHDLGDLRAALDLYEEAAWLSTPADGTDPAGRQLVHLRNHYLTAREHHSATGDPGSAAAAIATALRLDADPLGAGAVQWAARLLIDGTDLDGLRRAAVALRRVMGRVDGADATTLQLDLVAALRQHGDRTGRAEDLEAAVVTARDAVEHAEAEDRAAALSALGGAQLTWYRHTSMTAQLEAAIRNLREADLTSGGTDESTLTNLSSALQRRYEHFGEPADLDEAVTLSRRAAALAGPAGREHPAYAMNVAHALQMRYERFGRPGDIDEAIAVQWAAVAAAEPHSALAAMTEANLGTLHRVRFRRQRQPDDLEEAVRCARSALMSFQTHPGGFDRVGTAMIQLATALAECGRHLSRSDALDEAADLAMRAFPLLHDADHALRVAAASLLAERYRRDGLDEDASTAIGYLNEVCMNPLAAALVRAEAAALWGRLAEELGDMEMANTVFAEAVKVLTRLPFRGTTRRTRERALASASGVVGDAGAVALEVGDPVTAVARLEQGRGVLWAQQLELRGDLTRLTRHAPALAARLREVSRWLADDHPEQAVPTFAPSPPNSRPGRFQARRDRRGTVARPHPARSAAVGAIGRNWLSHGRLLLSRYDDGRARSQPNPASLDAAIRAFQRAVAAARDPRERADYLAELAEAWVQKGHTHGDVPALSAAVDTWRDALRVGARDQAESASWTASLALALLLRCNLTGEPADLDEAIERLDVATAAGGDDLDLAAWHLWRTTALHARWQDRGDDVDLDAAASAAGLTEAYVARLDQETQDVVRAALEEIKRGG